MKKCTIEFPVSVGDTVTVYGDPGWRVKEIMIDYNTSVQHYRGIPVSLIVRRDYLFRQAKRYIINGTHQNVWIPNKHLMPDGTLIAGENIDYIFRSHGHQLDLAGVTQAIPGIKRAEKNSKFTRREV